MKSPIARSLSTVSLMIIGVLVGRSAAQEPQKAGPSVAAVPVITSLCDLKKLSPCELEKVFASGKVGAMPVGYIHGEILHLANMSMPCFKARLVNKIWQGKVFYECGDFVNQWAHMQAVRSHVRTGCSYFDGNPAIIIEYPSNIPYFGKMRDEIREIAPGVYLAMVYELDCERPFRGFIGLEAQGCGCAGGGK